MARPPASRLFLLLTLVATGPVAHAGPGPADREAVAQAKGHFERGRELYQARDFEGAIREFAAAQSLAPSPILDHNIGVAYEQLGKSDLALQHYRRYLEAKPDAPNREDVEKRMAALSKAVPAPGRPECPEGQTVSEDTADHCCWPGQVWSKRRQACAGIPQCPAGFLAQGEACVQGGAVPPPPPPQPPPLWTTSPYQMMGNPWGMPMAPMAPMPPPAPPGTVPVTFAPKRSSYSYVVAVGKLACSTPCTLYLPPGRARVNVTGSGQFRGEINVPGFAANVRVEHLRIGNLVAGGIFTGLGVIALVAGAIVVSNSYSPFRGSNEDALYGGLAILTGLVCLPVGIPLMASSDRNRVQVLGVPMATREPAAAPQLIGLGLTPLAGGTGALAGATFRF